MDVGFYIEALNGFPGPFVKYVNEWLSQEDVIRLMQGKASRKAYFKDALAIAYPDGSTKVFTSKTAGTIAESVDLANTKWTMNSLFIPDGYSKTLGSMSDDEQTRFWDDGRTWSQLTDFLEQV
jgi:non-canonical purine NTP pyrophosphatase (RdgB/HAM1 family)